MKDKFDFKSKDLAKILYFLHEHAKKAIGQKKKSGNEKPKKK